MMKNLSDRSIYFAVRDAGIIASQKEFSRLCGRSPGWFAVLAARGLGMSITALGVLAANLARGASETGDEGQCQTLGALKAQVLQAMSARCESRARSATRFPLDQF